MVVSLGWCHHGGDNAGVSPAWRHRPGCGLPPAPPHGGPTVTQPLLVPQRRPVVPAESRLSLLLSLSLLGSVTALAAAAWGVYYMKSTACKKGEYNVRDAEGSSEAARLHRGDSGGQRELFGIPLTPT